jgi:two-component system sensor histidine kinase DevS
MTAHRDPNQPATLAEALDLLSQREAELQESTRQIAELRKELNDADQGLIALYTELENARADQEVMAERDRIARDLHDMVIQRVFGAGLALQGAVSLIDLPEVSARIEAVIDELDITVRELRGAIFALHHPRQAAGLRARLQDVVGGAQGGLGFAPTVSFEGPIDAVSDEIAVHLLAVVREALSNVTRHAHPSAVEVTLQAGDDLILRVVDDGRGFEPATRESGLANMRDRARILGGVCEVTSRPGAGTELLWRVPLVEHVEIAQAE